MKSPFAKDFWQRDNLRNTWEYKSIAFILRAMVALTVCMYVALTAPAILTWLKMESVRREPLESFNTVLASAIEKDSFDQVALWLRHRPVSEQATLTQALEKNIEYIPAPFITSIGQIASKEDKNKAAFWHLLARYRLRFDTLRCGQSDLVEKLHTLQWMAMRLSGQQQIITDVENDLPRMAETLQKVLDYDAKHPARNSPVYTCTLFESISKEKQNIAPPEVWSTIRHTLRLTTESGIAELKKQAAKEKTTTPDTEADKETLKP